MELGLAGRQVLITGATDRIGLECAHQLAEEGCAVALADSNPSALRDAVAEIREYEGSVTSHLLDLARPDHLQSLVNVVPSPDIVINNAGYVPAGRFDTIREKQWKKSWDVKVFGYIELCRLLLPQLEETSHGVIVNIVGLNKILAPANHVAQSSANAAIIGFTEAVGQRRAKEHPRVVAVQPGAVVTDEVELYLRTQAKHEFGSEHRWEELWEDSLIWGQVNDVASLVTFLCSERASHISGTTITIDGGNC